MSPDEAPAPAWEDGFAADPVTVGGTTLVEGTTFSVCSAGGDMRPGTAEGLFVLDARVLCRWQLELAGFSLEPLGGYTLQPFAGLFVARARQVHAPGEPYVIVERRRYVGSGMREDVTLRNHSGDPVEIDVALAVAADFADVFAVKVEKVGDLPAARVQPGRERWQADSAGADDRRRVVVHAPGSEAGTGGLRWRATIAPHSSWAASVEVSVLVNGDSLPVRFPLGKPIATAGPARRLDRWRRETPTVTSSSPALAATLLRSETDLGALRIVDPTAPEALVVAAGAPWFMAMFGRDSIIASWMMLPFNRQLAVGTLRALARYQGKATDDRSEEQPGRIPHEVRFGPDPSLAVGGGSVYYGSVDATPLFAAMVGELVRWGADRETIEGLLPACDRALEWIDSHGDSDGDGFVEYRRTSAKGLRNQGWKDSNDGINFADGDLADPPIALAEVQGYVFGAFRGRARVARFLGDEEAARHWSSRADRLKAAFNDKFWMPGAGYFATGLDGDKRLIDSVTSNIGHCLWSGIVDAGKAGPVAARLAGPDLFSGYGIRTLAASMGAYNPVSYHNGSVWPHDNAMAVGGLVRYGFVEEARRVATAMVDAAAHFAGRLPEVFCGFDRRAMPGPVPYPTSCSPQAWAAAAPVAVLTAMLGVSPDVPAGRVRLRPCLPAEWGRVAVRGLRLGHDTLAVEAEGSLVHSARSSSLTVDYHSAGDVEGRPLRHSE